MHTATSAARNGVREAHRYQLVPDLRGPGCDKLQLGQSPAFSEKRILQWFPVGGILEELHQPLVRTLGEPNNQFAIIITSSQSTPTPGKTSVGKVSLTPVDLIPATSCDW